MNPRVNIESADFPANYYNACGCNDTGLQYDLLLNEIAELINNAPMTLIQLLADSGHEFKGTTRRQLVNDVVEQMHDNLQFRTALSLLIGMNNGMVSSAEILSYSDTGRPQHYNDISGIGDAIGGIFGGIGSMVSSHNQANAIIEKSKNDLAAARAGAQSQADIAREQTKQAILTTMQSKYQNTAGGASGTAILIIGLLFLAGLGWAGWYFFIKEDKPKMSAAA